MKARRYKVTLQIKDRYVSQFVIATSVHSAKRSLVDYWSTRHDKSDIKVIEVKKQTDIL